MRGEASHIVRRQEKTSRSRRRNETVAGTEQGTREDIFALSSRARSYYRHTWCNILSPSSSRRFAAFFFGPGTTSRRLMLLGMRQAVHRHSARNRTRERPRDKEKERDEERQSERVRVHVAREGDMNCEGEDDRMLPKFVRSLGDDTTVPPYSGSLTLLISPPCVEGSSLRSLREGRKEEREREREMRRRVRWLAIVTSIIVVDLYVSSRISRGFHLILSLSFFRRNIAITAHENSYDRTQPASSLPRRNRSSFCRRSASRATWRSRGRTCLDLEAGTGGRYRLMGSIKAKSHF